MTALDFVDDELAALEARGRRRGVRVVGGRRGAEILLDGRWVVSFSSNDYLGLASAPELIAAAGAAMAVHGVGASASRLITGTTDEVVELERELAAFHGGPAALVFGSGYAANTGLIPALVGRGDVVFSDELNHASIIDGCRLSRAEVRVFGHRDVGELERGLASGRWRRRLVVSESVFSMDGDRAPLDAIARVARAADALLMVDDAHAVGACGEGGRGYGMAAGADVVVGTLGKAFGTAGAYVVGQMRLIQHLWNRARSLVFSTSQPPAVMAATRASLRLVAGDAGASRRASLRARERQVRLGLHRLGLPARLEDDTPIIPIVVGDDRQSVACTEALLELGMLVQAIRPPTVPEGTARLRVAVSAAHTEPQVESLLEGLAGLVRCGLIVA